MKQKLCCQVKPSGSMCKYCERLLCLDCAEKGYHFKKEVITWAERAIEEAIGQDGQYSHNICSSALRAVAIKINYKEANKLVDAYQLEKLYGIPKHI